MVASLRAFGLLWFLLMPKQAAAAPLTHRCSLRPHHERVELAGTRICFSDGRKSSIIQPWRTSVSAQCTQVRQSHPIPAYPPVSSARASRNGHDRGKKELVGLPLRLKTVFRQENEVSC